MATFEPNDYLQQMLQKYKLEIDPTLNDFSIELENTTPNNVFRYLPKLQWPDFGAPVSDKKLDRTLFDRWTPFLDKWSLACQKQTACEPVWQLDFDRLSEAMVYLGLTWDLQISPLYRFGILGAHHGALLLPTDWKLDQALHIEEQLHIITLDPGLSPTAASLCLWHELTHAAQAEKHDTPWAFYKSILDENRNARAGTIEYFNNWWETEAFTNMDLHFEVGSLMRPA